MKRADETWDGCIGPIVKELLDIDIAQQDCVDNTIQYTRYYVVQQGENFLGIYQLYTRYLM